MKRDIKNDIAVAGFLMTAEEWAELDPESRAELLGVAIGELAAMSGTGQCHEEVRATS